MGTAAMAFAPERRDQADLHPTDDWRLAQRSSFELENDSDALITRWSKKPYRAIRRSGKIRRT
ncbi:MAG: hypothetical protein R3F11_16740 [Verrucomicrobiales bacterium]